MAFDEEFLRKHIPYYLVSDPAKKDLAHQLTALIGGASTGYFIPLRVDPYSTVKLQGDGWSGFQILSFVSGNRRNIRGVILSNSCDIDLNNDRALPPNIAFAPLVKLESLRARFVQCGLNKDRTEAKLAAIRAQKMTSIFYLPAEVPLEDEYAVLLDDVHSMPLDALQGESSKLFTLSMAGFYLFIFKLSIHFCRLHENVNRSANLPEI